MATDYTELNASKRSAKPRSGEATPPANGASRPANGGSHPTNAVLDDPDLIAGLAGINPAFGELCVRVAGEVWGKPLVDQKTKALIAIAIDVVNQSLNGPGTPFGAHVSMAMKQGATRAEIEEILLFTCAYAGFNKAAGAFGALKALLGSG
jgi:4-carboxymuconolactone decarboxylase